MLKDSLFVRHEYKLIYILPYIKYLGEFLLPKYFLNVNVIVSPPPMDCVIASALLAREFLAEGLEPLLILNSVDSLRHLKLSSNYVLVCLSTELKGLCENSKPLVILANGQYNGVYRRSRDSLEPVDVVYPAMKSVTRLIAHILRLKVSEAEVLASLAEGTLPGLTIDNLSKASLIALARPSYFYRIVESVERRDLEELRTILEELIDEYSKNEARYVAEMKGRVIKVKNYTLIYYNTCSLERIYVSEVIDELMRNGHNKIIVLGGRNDKVTKLEFMGIPKDEVDNLLRKFHEIIEDEIKINNIVKTYIKYPFIRVQDVIKLLK